MGSDNKKKRIKSYQQIYNPFNKKLIGQIHSNRRIMLQGQNSSRFQKHRHFSAFTQKIGRKVRRKFQNSPKIRRPFNKDKISRWSAPRVPHIPKLAGGILQNQTTKKTIRPTQPLIFNKTRQKMIHPAQVNQKIHKPFPQIQVTKKVRRPFLNTKAAQQVRRPFLNIRAAQQVRRPFLNTKAAQQVRRPFLNTKAAQQVRRPFLNTKAAQQVRRPFQKVQTLQNLRKPFPKPSKYKVLQRGNIKVYKPHELLRMAPRSEKNLWALIISRLPQNYTIPDINFVNLYRAFHQRRPKI